MTATARVTATDSVVRHLAHLVLAELDPGSDPPRESDLAAELGVSRLTVGEAVKALQARGLASFTAMEPSLHASRLQSLRGHLARGGTVDDVIAQHELILARVKARDPKGAAAAMREHLAQTARDLRAAFALADTLD